MQREFTYQLSFDRVIGLSDSMLRKVDGFLPMMRWLFVTAFLLVTIVIGFNFDELFKWSVEAGYPLGIGAMLVIAFVVLLTALTVIARIRARRVQEHVNFNLPIRLTQDDGGLRFATDEIEHYLKWRGISRMWLEPDGVAILQASLCMLIPNTAFADAGERNAFIRNVYGRMNEDARSRSKRDLRQALANGGGA
jgi:uncharacterized membrane protein (DUF485 family)